MTIPIGAFFFRVFKFCLIWFVNLPTLTPDRPGGWLLLPEISSQLF